MSISATTISDADRLYALLFGDWKPKRASRMTGRSDQARKYTDIQEYSFSRALLADHLDGRETYAATLGLAGEARSGCKDYDSAGEAEILSALAKAAERDITAVAFILTDPAGGHTGGHLWAPYDQPYPEADIRAQLRTIPRAGKGDDTRDDSDSAQVAALAFALLSADVCESQARAIADYLKPQLRPGRTLEHYRPAHYKPQVIRYLGTASGEAPQALPEAQHKPEPKSRARKDRPQKAAGPLGYLETLARIRKLNISIQINVAAAGGQQVNVSGGVAPDQFTCEG